MGKNKVLDTLQKVVDTMNTNKGKEMTVNEISEKSGVWWGGVKNYLNFLEKNSWIRRRKGKFILDESKR